MGRMSVPLWQNSTHTKVPDGEKRGLGTSCEETFRAGRPSPGARLMAAASLVRPGRPVADIGCDHGKTSVWLVMSGLAPRVIAVDLRPAPLARAKALARRCGVADRVDCRLGDGLAPLAAGEAEDVLVTGLSGETIAEILQKTPWLRDDTVHLVLQPTTRAPVLRRWLCENGFFIETEKPVLERTRAYTNLSVYYRGGEDCPTDLFCEVGLLPKAGGLAACKLVQNRLTDLYNQRKAPAPQVEKRRLKTLIDEVEKCLKSLK